MNSSGSASSTTPTEPSPATDEAGETDSAPNTLLNGLIGGIVGVVFAFVPFSTVLGGGVAGYLEGGSYASGAKVGAIAGFVSFLPFVVILGIGLAVVPVVAVPGPGVQLALWVSVLLIVLLAVLYTVGLGSIGGILGVYVKEEV